MKKDKLFNECWQDLANAVVLRAVADYRWTQKLLKQKSDSCEKRLELRRLEHFFCSNWFRTLTALDGPQLLADLRKETAS